MADTLTLSLRSYAKAQDQTNHNIWQESIETVRIAGSKIVILLCDMWDTHTQDGAGARVNEMAPRMNEILKAARRKGVHILHGPNDCLDFYKDHPARKRMAELPVYLPPRPLPHEDVPAPIPSECLVSDTGSVDRKYSRVPWTRQHAAIEIDPQKDGITVSGGEIYSYMRIHGIERYLIMGVHTNMCILHRTFGIKQMVRWGVPTALVRDLTDAIYNPHQPPYLTHDDGTRLFVGYIERFWCPSIESGDLVR